MQTSHSSEIENSIVNYIYFSLTMLYIVLELDTHLLEKNQTRVVVCGRFIPQDVAIRIKKKTNRRVEILDIQDLSESNAEMEDQKPMTNNWTLLATQNKMETCLA